MKTAVLKKAEARSRKVVDGFVSLFGSGCFNGGLTGLNGLGLKRLQYLGFPNKKNEMFTYVNTDIVAESRLGLIHQPVTIQAETFKNLVYGECEKSFIAIVDGIYAPGLSNFSQIRDKVRVEPLEAAVTKDPVLRARLYENASRETDAFASMNDAFAISGVKVTVDDDAFIANPVQLLFISTRSDGKTPLTAPRAHVRIGDGARVTFAVKYVGMGGDYFRNAVVEFDAGAGSETDVVNIYNDTGQSISFSKTAVTQHEMSKMRMVTVAGGSRLSRINYDWEIAGAGAMMDLKSLAVADGENQAHSYARITHETGNNESRMLFKNILKDSGRISTDGTVVVKPGAQQTKSNQLIKNLMMSPNARAYNKPNLMIYADDVKCAHGATIGQLDPDQLLYLNSRGIGPRAALRILMDGFAREILGETPVPSALEEAGRIMLGKPGTEK